MQWCRLYTDVVDNPKVQRLPENLFKVWINVLCLATRNNGVLPEIGDLAFSLRMSETYTSQAITDLIAARLLDITETGVAPHDWDARQYKGDVSTERVGKYRQRVKENGEKVGEYQKYREEIGARDGGQCVYCASTKTLVLDHVVPVIQGGKGVLENLVLACKSCNSGKAGRTPFEAKLKFRNRDFEDFCHRAVTSFCHRDSNAPEAEAEADTESKGEVPFNLEDFIPKTLLGKGAGNEWNSDQKYGAWCGRVIPVARAAMTNDKFEAFLVGLSNKDRWARNLGNKLDKQRINGHA